MREALNIRKKNQKKHSLPPLPRFVRQSFIISPPPTSPRPMPIKFVGKPQNDVYNEEDDDGDEDEGDDNDGASHQRGFFRGPLSALKKLVKL
jgi:hypothetical protein